MLEMPAGTEVAQSLVRLFEGASMERNFVVNEQRRIPSSFSSSSLSSLLPKTSEEEEEKEAISERRHLALPPILELSANGSAHHYEKIEAEKICVCVEFKPSMRSGVWSDIGPRSVMEDDHVVIDNLIEHLGSIAGQDSGAYYGVFDGHNGKDAARFVRERLLNFIVRDAAFPTSVEKAVHHAFLHTDTAFAEACLADQNLSSGTTALTVLVLGRQLFVANVGDCRAVLCKKGKAIELSRDHKPSCILEKRRIEAHGGFVCDGYLNGQLSVARAIGNWHIKGLKGVNCPLSAEPEVRKALLTEEDEFMIIGCDGLWDVFSSQNAIDFARRKLQQHNDPEECSHDLVNEALHRDSCDNLTVVTVCFQKNPPPKLMNKFVGRRSISIEGLRSLQGVLDRSM